MSKPSLRTLSDLRDHAKNYEAEVEQTERLDRIEEEFRAAFDFLQDLPHSISIYGSTQVKPGDLYYEKARELASRIVSEKQIAVVTGGGPGIMEAANRGAAEAGGVSAGLRIDLGTGEGRNTYANRTLDFHYFFARKMALSFAASMYVFFPGGFGTMDEFFELVTLVQTKKIAPLPIMCFGASYWDPLVRFMDYYMLRHDRMIAPADLAIFTVTDDLNQILSVVEKAPVRT